MLNIKKTKAKKSQVLTTEAITEIERLHSEGISIKSISEQTGINYSTIKKGLRAKVFNYPFPVPLPSVP